MSKTHCDALIAPRSACGSPVLRRKPLSYTRLGQEREAELQTLVKVR
jgi:hypothetical protein